MTPERWEQIDRLFYAALEHEPAERPAFLARSCADDEPLRHEVESLLASHELAESFIEEPAADLAAAVFAEEQHGLAAGQVVGPFRVEGVLAAGGMGEVYLAEDTRLGRRIALKLLPRQFTADPDRVGRFVQEARAASALNHPNILTVHDIGLAGSSHYIAAEFVEGETLREHMAKARMTLGEALDVAAQIASALQAAHAAGIVHRDIKPENVMLRRDRLVKVLDFGLAKLAPRQAEAIGAQVPAESMVRTNPGVVMGTVQYMSPEQALGQEVDARSDIWSLGVVLHEMLTGLTPFAGETPSHVIVSILEGEPPPLARSAEVPGELERIVTKTLRKDREERYQTAGDLALDLKSLRQELEIEARLKRASQPDANNRGTRAPRGGRAADATAYQSAARTADVAPARPTSSAEYIVSEIKPHRRGAALAAVVLLAALAAAAYLFYAAQSGEAIDSVAVLPFVNTGGDPDAEYLSDGISDGVISSLSRLPELRVISLNSVLRYKGRQTDPQTIGREQNVRAVLLGRLTRRGDELAISTELVDVKDNRRLWGEQYNRKLSDILAVQEEIAREITEGLRLRLTGEERKRLAKNHTENTEAYQLYILGRHYFRKQTKEDFERSIGYYEQAIKADPNYALAFAGLARAYHWMGTRGFWPAKESEQKVEWAALKALQLDDTLAESHVRLGVIKFNNFDWAGAERELKRALELDPNSPEANGAYFQYLAGVGRVDEALRYAIRAQQLGPTPEPEALAYAYLVARQYDAAIESYLKDIEKNPDNAHGHVLLGEAYAAKGLHKEAVAMMQKGVALDKTLAQTPERWDRYPMLAYAYAVAGRRGEALKILGEQQRLAGQRYVSPYNFAIIYTGLGDKDRAFEWLDKAVEQRTRLVFRVKSRPLFDPLRSDPRYAELLRRMNLEP